MNVALDPETSQAVHMMAVMDGVTDAEVLAAMATLLWTVFQARADGYQTALVIYRDKDRADVRFRPLD